MKNSALALLFAITIFSQQLFAQSLFKSPTQESTEFRFTTLNTNWLSCSQYGPIDDELQINNLVKTIKFLNSDLIALQEVGTSSSYNTIDTIVRRLGNDWGGSMIYSTFTNCSQNQGIIYKKANIQLINASLITNGGTLYDWSNGRYPALYNVNLVSENGLIPVSIINIHAKASSDATSYLRRKNASIGLKTLLDSNDFNTKKVVIIGDFNDYLSGTQCSVCSPAESPYKNFIDDIENYKCLSNSLTDPSYNSPVIDNIIISNELFENYVPYSTKFESSVTQEIPDYYNTTTDHLPITATFTTSTTEATCQSLSVSETFASGLGYFTPYSISGAQTWSWRAVYGALMSGFLNSMNYQNEDWLISPSFNLSANSSASFSFDHALNFAPVLSEKLANHTLWLSTDYADGNSPLAATWTQLTIPNMPAGNNWTVINSGNIEIPTEFLQKNVHIAFKYLCTATASATWEMKNFLLNSACLNTNTTKKAEIQQSTITVVNKHIRVLNQQNLPVAVLDITGRKLFSAPSTQCIEIPVMQSGIYIVRTGNKANKVVVE